MSNANLESIFRDLCAPILPSAQIDALIAQCWKIDSMRDVGLLARMMVPQPRV